MPAMRLDPRRTALLVVDVQERMLPHMEQPDLLRERVEVAVACFHALDLPVLVTEQAPEKLGPTDVAAIREAPEKLALRAAKTRFSACVEPITEALGARAIHSVLLCGIEAHVCVLQSCLDLLEAGYVVAVAADGAGSRRRPDREAALARMQQSGVLISSVESAVLEIAGDAKTEHFKAVLPIIR